MRREEENRDPSWRRPFRGDCAHYPSLGVYWLPPKSADARYQVASRDSRCLHWPPVAGSSSRQAHQVPSKWAARASAGEPALRFSTPNQLAPLVASLIFFIASSMVKVFGFCTAGNSLKVSANLAA